MLKSALEKTGLPNWAEMSLGPKKRILRGEQLSLGFQTRVGLEVGPQNYTIQTPYSEEVWLEDLGIS